MVGGRRSVNQLDHGDFAMVVGWQLPTHWHGPIMALIAWVATIVAFGGNRGPEGGIDELPTIKRKRRI